jgi:hypothetical protein
LDDGVGADAEPEASLIDRFFDTRLAAFRICRAIFSSSKMDFIVSMFDLAMDSAVRALSELTRRAFTLSRAYA